VLESASKGWLKTVYKLFDKGKMRGN